MIYKIIGFLIQDKFNFRKSKDIRLKKILIINLQGMGDYIMTTPLIKELSKKYKVDLLSNCKAVNILKTDLNNVIYFNGLFKTWNKIRKEKYDLIYLTNGNGVKSGLYFMILFSKLKASHIYKLGGFKTSYFSNIRLKQDLKMHRVDENFKLLKYLNLDIPKSPKYFINIDKDIENKIKKYIKKNNMQDLELIGIHPGGDVNNLSKRFPIKKYCDFVNSLNDNKKALFFLGPDEDELKSDIKKYCKKDNYLIIQKSLMEIICLIKECSYLIHSDSGLGHIASSVGTKTYTIVGPTNWYKTKPYGKKDVILKHPKQKDPIEKNIEKGFISKKDFKFIDKIKLG